MPPGPIGETTDRFAQVYDRTGRLLLETPEHKADGRPQVSGTIMERVLAGTTKLLDLRSVSVFGLSLVTLTFEEGTRDAALGGLDKGSFLSAFQPDFFFDDQTRHCDSAAQVAPTGHVVAGVKNG